MKTKAILLTFILFTLLTIKLEGQNFSKPQLTLTLFAQGFSRPADIKNCGDSRMFVVQQRGVIIIIDSLGNVKPTPFLDITSKVKSSGGEQGLLGLAFSPDYLTNGIFYIYYVNYKGPSGNIVISRFNRSNDNPDIADNTEEKLLEVWHPFTNHNGGGIAFGPDGYLYMGLGDGGSGGDPGNRAQNLDSLLGKMLRIDVSNPGAYTIPSDNPFINTPNARHEIWAYGLRNPWRWSFDKLKHDLWIADVGQNLWEEVDFQKAGDPGGENYGWNCWEGTVKYSGCNPQNVTFPVYTYYHNSSNCSVTGGYVYRGALYGGLFGRYLLTDYCSGRFMSIRPKPSGGWTVDTLTTTPAYSTNDYSSFGLDHNGEMYIAGNASGKIWKIGDTACAPTAFITNPDTIVTCSSALLNAIHSNKKSLTYQWMLNDNPIDGATIFNYSAATQGNYKIKVSNGKCSSLSKSVYVSIPKPDVSFSGLDSSYCNIDQEIVLFGSPYGGTFSGTGITGNIFDTFDSGVGTFTITYNYTDMVSGCSNSDAKKVVVNPLPEVSFSGLDTSYCIYNNAVVLTGNPEGGIFSGSGISQNIFNPSTAGTGNHTIIYDFTDTITGCDNISSKDVKINVCSGINNMEFIVAFSIFPNPNDGTFNVKLNVPAKTEIDIKVTDLIGRIYMNIFKELSQGDNTIPVKIDNISPGIYFIQLNTNQGQITRKIIVNN